MNPAALPTPSGIHHVKLPVTDLERSAHWYAEVLGARRLTDLDHRRPDGTLFAVILDVPGLGTHLELRLDPATASALKGYDFLTLAVDDRTALDTWMTHLDTLGVLHSPPVVALAGWLLVVPDPDGQRLRFYTTTHHGLDPSRVEYDSPWLSTGPAPSNEPAPRIMTTIAARPGADRELENLLTEFADTTRHENGCLAFRVHRTPQAPDTFILYEEWTGRQALDAHRASIHMNSFRTRATHLAAAPPHTQTLVPCPEHRR
ncbi:antibiotic biosynthesis monooxygenase [Streptomyces sp. NPDC006670]|uniref:antibiotic biosynthesis monooxygenase n=1 Tax=Streptomyces sp. NPDC006670 TaxID=3154476 RepID=UPI00340CC828